MVDGSRVVAIRDMSHCADYYDCFYYNDCDGEDEFVYDRYEGTKYRSRFNSEVSRWGYVDSVEKLVNLTPFGIKIITDSKEIKKFLMTKELLK